MLASDPTPEQGAGGMSARGGAQAKVNYQPPVMGYFTVDMTVGMALEVIVHLHATKSEFELSEATENFLSQLITNYPGDLPEGIEV